MKYYIVNFRDESQVRLSEKGGESLKKSLIEEDAKWFSVRDRVYTTNGIISVIPAEMDEIALKNLGII